MKKRNITIGIPGARTEQIFGAGLNNLEYISKFGNPRIIMPWEEYVKVDVLYLPGGMDVRPDTYGEVPEFKTSNQDIFKQFFFDHRLDNYISTKTPILGVCAGFQQVAIKFGCKLTQDLKWHPQSKDRWVPSHEIFFTDSGMVYAQKGIEYDDKGKEKPYKVNSHHHQGVLDKDFNRDELEVLAYYPEDKNVIIIEAFKHHKLPIACVQYHPEEWYDIFTEKLFESIIN